MRLLLLCAWVVLASSLPASQDERIAKRKRYDEYQVWELTAQNDRQLELLKNLYQDIELDFWSVPAKVGQKVRVLIPPNKVVFVTTELRQEGLTANVHSENFQKELDVDWARIDKRAQDGTLQEFDYDDYNTYEAYQAEIEILAADCPAGVQCSTRVIGSSYEGRDISLLQISGGTCPEPQEGKRGIWLDSHLHAREWLTGATLMKIVDHLVRSYDSDPVAQHLLDCYDWYIVPVMNPDGYAFSWDEDRMWRKSRSVNNPCFGVDLNRNYDWRWGDEGTSSNPCSDTYLGTSPASEPETQTVQAEGARLNDQLLAWVSFHSYGNYWLLPYGNCDLPTDYADLFQVIDVATDAVEATHDSVWTRGNGCEILYAVTGNTQDWAKDNANAKYASTLELVGGGSGGFDPPPSFIQPSYEEIWNGIARMMIEIEFIENS